MILADRSSSLCREKTRYDDYPRRYSLSVKVFSQREILKKRVIVQVFKNYNRKWREVVKIGYKRSIEEQGLESRDKQVRSRQCKAHG